MVITFGSAILMLLSQVTLRLTLDRRVRKAMPADKVYNSPLDWYGGFMRAMGFGLAAIFDRAKHYAMKDHYDGFDVKNFANTFEKIISYLFVVSSIILISCVVIFSIIDLLGIIDWPDE